MITYVNKANADQYSFLYSEASEDLRTHKANGEKVEYGHPEALKGFDPITLTADTYMEGRYYVLNDENKYVICNDKKENFDAQKQYFVSDDITSLDEYFSYIVQLNEINRRYTILPLDEDVFEIDADTRQISVPKIFQTNGIGVQGDEVAEIVYFKIRRFYDATDLDTKDIYIQWRSAATDDKGNPIDGVSVPWVKDVESEPGYIIFGWPLSSRITQKSGTIQFAVRFYEFDQDKDILTYSLSTLTQTAVIKPALDFNLPDIIMDKTLIDDARDMISDRFENSEVQNGAVKAMEPEWTVDLVEHKDLDVDEQGFRTVPYSYSVQAMAPDAGQISYIWKKYSIDDKRRLDINYEITMAKTKDTERKNDGKLYFYMKDDKTYDKYMGTLDATDPEYPKSGVFERFSTAVIDSIGEYYVIATNRVRQSTATKETLHLIVPRPKTPVIQTNLEARGVLEEKKDYEITLAPVATVADQGKLTYQWYRKGPKDLSFEPIEGATDATLKIDGAAIEVQKNTAGKLESVDNLAETEGGVGDGYYKVKITNNLNVEVDGKTRAIDEIESSVCRVTHPASKVTFSYLSNMNFTMNDITVDKEYMEIAADIEDAYGENCQRVEGEDTITYQWYRYFAGLNGIVEEDIKKAMDGQYELNEDVPVEGATETRFQPSVPGYYFCYATNTYNGTTASKASQFFRVIDA